MQRHLRECKNQAARIRDFAQFETHEVYLGGLKQSHGKETSFGGQSLSVRLAELSGVAQMFITYSVSQNKGHLQFIQNST